MCSIGLFSELHSGFSKTTDTQWTPMMERALNVVFFISEHPQKFGGKILIEMMQLLQKVMNGIVFISSFVYFYDILQMSMWKQLNAISIWCVYWR
jgi:hypothetical protein